MGSFPAKLAWPLLLSFALGGDGAACNSATPPRGSAQASGMARATAANIPAARKFDICALSLTFKFIRPIPFILNPDRTNKFRLHGRKFTVSILEHKFSASCSFLSVLCVKAFDFSQRTQNLTTEDTEKTGANGVTC